MISLQKPTTAMATVKFLCSYGGKILPRPSDGLLRYVGGHTRVVSVLRSVSISELLAKLSEMCGHTVALRCQLPDEEMDVLVSIKSDEDLASIIDEYDRASSLFGKQLKIRAILTPTKPLIRSNNSSPLSSSSSCADLSLTKSSDPDSRQFTRSTAQMFPRSISSTSAVGSVSNFSCRSSTVCPQYVFNRDRTRFQPSCHVQVHSRPLVLHSNYRSVEYSGGDANKLPTLMDPSFEQNNIPW